MNIRKSNKDVKYRKYPCTVPNWIIICSICSLSHDISIPFHHLFKTQNKAWNIPVLTKHNASLCIKQTARITFSLPVTHKTKKIKWWHCTEDLMDSDNYSMHLSLCVFSFWKPASFDLIDETTGPEETHFTGHCYSRSRWTRSSIGHWRKKKTMWHWTHEVKVWIQDEKHFCSLLISQHQDKLD